MITPLKLRYYFCLQSKVKNSEREIPTNGDYK